MKKLFETWRHYKLLLEQEDTEGEEKKDLPDKELRKQVSQVEEDFYPIQKWADENGFTLREIDGDRLQSYLGQGAYGKAFAAVKNGREYAVKIGSTGREEEMNIIDKMISMRDKLPEEVARHIVKFYSPSELGFQDEVYDERGQLFYVSVAELLQPLTPGDLKKLESSKWKDRFHNVEVDKNPFWQNEEWDEVENALLDKLPNINIIKRMFIDALYETRFLISKEEKQKLLTFANDFESREGDYSKKVIKSKGKEPLDWETIWTEMVADKLPGTDKGKILVNFSMKKFGLDGPGAVSYIWEMVRKAGKIIFFSDIPVSYEGDDDANPDSLPAGELKSFNKAMKILRDEFGVVANDIHEGNIMRRGNDWVIMDVGAFRLGD